MPLSAFSFPFGQAYILKTIDYNSYKNTQQQSLSSSFYRVGDSIPLVYKLYQKSDSESSSSYYVKDLLRLPISSSNDNGFCQYLNVAEFRRNVVAQASVSSAVSNQYYGDCVVPVSTDDAEEMEFYCRNEFNIERYIKEEAVFSK